MAEHYTFADSEQGLAHALHITLSLRAYGYHTRLVTRQLTRKTRIHTVIATPPTRPNRDNRGCYLNKPKGE